MKRKMVRKFLAVMAGAFLLSGNLSDYARAEEAAQETVTEEVTQETVTEGATQETVTEEAAQETVTEEAAQETVTEDAAQETVTEEATQEDATEEATAGTETSEEAAKTVAEGVIVEALEEDGESQEVVPDEGQGTPAETESGTAQQETSAETQDGVEEQAESDVDGEIEEIFTETLSAETNLLNGSAASIEMEGIPIISSGSTYQLVTSGSEVYKGNYNLLGDSNNKAQFVFTPFNNAGTDVAYVETATAKYLVPKAEGAGGKYGFLVENVGFNSEENCTLDIRFTVTGYKTYMYDKSGGKVDGVYPAFGFWPEHGLTFAFAGPDQNIKIEILKHGTNTLVKGDYSFRWLDIDAGQRFGISLADGALTGRYALNTCSVYYQDGFSRFNREYHMVNGAQTTDYTTDKGNWLNGTVYWELQDCSQINLLIAAAGNSSVGRYSESAIQSRYEQYSTGTFTDKVGSIIGALGWDGESYGPRENPTQLYKYVSNQDETIENLNGKTENALEANGQAYYYFLENYVPVEPEAYYYSLYTVTDTLPAGVDYNGAVQVIKGETGQDVTSWFNISAENDTVTFSANHMGQSEFYGSTYIYKILVRLNTGEITPTCEGNQNVYTVKNTATVTSSHKTDSAPKSGVSNEVTTTMRELGRGNLRVIKTDTAGQPLAGAVFEIRAAGDILSPSGAVLVPSTTVAATLTTGGDGTALAEGLYAGTYTVTEVKPPDGFSLNTVPAQAEVPGNGTGCAEVGFQNEKTRVYLKKVSQLMEGETEQQPISGVSFLVWRKESGEAQGSLYTTDAGGLICLEGFTPGEYCYREESTPEGYVPDSTVREFTIDTNGWVSNEPGHVILVENACICAEFAKTDRVTGQPVSGAALRLTDALGQEVDSWISGDTPHRINRIPAGTYTLTELSAPEGYKMGAPVTCVVSAQAGLQSFALPDLKYVEISITKTIHASEVVWAHGNPIFTFVVSGTDLDGDAYERTEVLEFTRENTGDSAEGDFSLSTRVSVPAGTYTVRELSTARYRLESLTVSENGTVQGEEALLDLTGNQAADVRFTNTKITDQYLTETALVRNQIIK